MREEGISRGLWGSTLHHQGDFLEPRVCCSVLGVWGVRGVSPSLPSERSQMTAVEAQACPLAPGMSLRTRFAHNDVRTGFTG